jgi:predicted  nucleic acid-binding Zn-ribbon protein
MNNEPTELGPGAFGIPQAQGNGISHEADAVLFEAEGRARGAESKAAELEGELASIRERSARMDEQFERLRVQLEALAEPSAAAISSAAASDPGPAKDAEEAMFGAHTPVWTEVGPSAVGEPSWAGPDESYAAGWEPEAGALAPSVAEAEEPAPAEAETPPPPDVQHQAWSEPAPLARDIPTSVRQGSGDLTPSVAGEQIALILAAAQEAAQRIVDQAQAGVDQQMADLSRRRRQAEDEASELAAWRDQVRSMLDSLSSDIEEVRVGLAEIPGRLAEAFAPLGERIPGIQKDMADLARALRSTGLSPNPESPEDHQRLAG